MTNATGLNLDSNPSRLWLWNIPLYKLKWSVRLRDLRSTHFFSHNFFTIHSLPSLVTPTRRVEVKRRRKSGRLIPRRPSLPPRRTKAVIQKKRPGRAGPSRLAKSALQINLETARIRPNYCGDCALNRMNLCEPATQTLFHEAPHDYYCYSCYRCSDQRHSKIRRNRSCLQKMKFTTSGNWNCFPSQQGAPVESAGGWFFPWRSSSRLAEAGELSGRQMAILIRPSPTAERS